MAFYTFYMVGKVACGALESTFIASRLCITSKETQSESGQVDLMWFLVSGDNLAWYQMWIMSLPHVPRPWESSRVAKRPILPWHIAILIKHQLFFNMWLAERKMRIFNLFPTLVRSVGNCRTSSRHTGLASPISARNPTVSGNKKIHSSF